MSIGGNLSVFVHIVLLPLPNLTFDRRPWLLDVLRHLMMVRNNMIAISDTYRRSSTGDRCTYSNIVHSTFDEFRFNAMLEVYICEVLSHVHAQ